MTLAPAPRNVSGFLTLCLTCFALVGVTLYHGSLQYDCVENAPTSVSAKEWVNLTTAPTWPC
jgi:hypothetical protein